MSGRHHQVENEANMGSTDNSRLQRSELDFKVWFKDTLALAGLVSDTIKYIQAKQQSVREVGNFPSFRAAVFAFLYCCSSFTGQFTDAPGRYFVCVKLCKSYVDTDYDLFVIFRRHWGKTK